MNVQKRHHTQHSIDKQLDRMIFLAAQQRLLPKIIYQFSYQHNQSKYANHYRNSIKKIYTKQTSTPLKYNQQQAKTHRQKFRQKIQKLINNQLPIDYLKPIKYNGKYIMTYKNHPLEKIKYETKPQYAIFGDFSQNKFKHKFNDVFDDKLEYRHEQVLSPIHRQKPIRNKTTPNEVPTLSRPQKPSKTTQINTPKQSPPVLPLLKLVARTQLDRSKLASPKAGISALSNKKKPRQMKNVNEEEEILKVMIKIGGYSNRVGVGNISVTRESILRYFREFYGRPLRIVDFLEFNQVQNYATYSKKPQNLKFMPNQHIYFMVFLFYDTNNDGYICNNDLLRVEQLGKKCPLLLSDVQIIRAGSSRVKFQNKLKYFQLYRLSEVTETTYFNWLKKEKKNDENPQQQHNQQLKAYFDNLNRRKIQMHYQGFKSLFSNEKPYLWYDILYRVSGIKYQGLKYQ